MKPPPFSYCAPQTVGEALGVLAEHGPDAKVLAGGQSLIPLLNLRLARPEVLVDICQIAELCSIGGDGETIRIGAAARQASVMDAQLVRDEVPLVCEALRHVGHPAIRARGTFGGSLAHADPAAELPAAMIALEAELVAQGRAGTRVISADEFFRGYFETALAEDEMLTEVRIKRPPPGRSVWGFAEIARRHGDFAMAGTVFAAQLDEADLVQRARIVLFGVGPAPVRAKIAEEALAGKPLGASAASSAAESVPATIAPPSDIHASAEWRREVAGVLVRRCIMQASGREG